MSKKPDLMEAIFDACYLIFDLIAGILFFVYSKGNPLFILYGVLNTNVVWWRCIPFGSSY